MSGANFGTENFSNHNTKNKNNTIMESKLPNNQIQQVAKKPLPKIDELYGNIELAGKFNSLNRLLNCEPKKEWLKPHPFAKRKYFDEKGQEHEGPALFIPISIVEYLLTSIYLKWRVEIKTTQLIGNSVEVTIRLHVLDPITGEWDWQDGIGASPVHTEKGAGATQFDKILTYSVMTAAPAAESFAVKDAAEKFGKIFGKDINRRDWLSYTTLDNKLDLSKLQAAPEQYSELFSLLYSAEIDPEEKDILQEKLQGFISIEEFYSIKKQLTDLQMNEVDQVRNGKTSYSNGELINKAVKQAVDRDV
jgi:hypothetical protein